MKQSLNHRLERAVRRGLLCAAGARKQRVPAALVGRHRAAAQPHR